MFYDLNVPINATTSTSLSKKGKGKQQTLSSPQFTAAQLSAIDAHLDLLIHLGYTVICFNQTVHKKVDPKIHVNVLNELLEKLKSRQGIVFLKRLSVILDEDSEKGFGLINANTSYFNSYDILSLIPTNQATFALACLTHTLPSPLTTHIISIPLTLPRFPFYLKHTLIRTAIKNGAVFEINYVGALGGESDPVLIETGAAEAHGGNAKRNWWAAARELVRVTKGKGLIVAGGVVTQADMRAPRDVANLIALLGIPQDAAHAACTSTPKSLVLRAQTRKTFRAVFSEPELVIPEGCSAPTPSSPSKEPTDTNRVSSNTKDGQKKRPREDDNLDTNPKLLESVSGTIPVGQDNTNKKKKRKKQA
ncbi:RNase P subunit p30-domain-containing protein [Rhodocollybia butyracea]|uniref:RNase P subunit p30-domain-containing protein n=1 Tax=Rhodocollybia butyracea TaxID=206335 RepID=A0A9P5QA87_9AGAR|nr:RNase P subunit p30-domain-containing protein [Rhodocollybia butyracea]